MPTASSPSARGTYRAGGGRFARPLDLPSSRALSRSTPNLSSDKRRRQRAVSQSPSPPRHDCGITAPGVYSFRAKPAPSFVLTPVTPTYSRQQYLSHFSEQRPPYGIDGDSGRDVPFYPPSLHPHSPEAQIRLQRLRDTRKLYRSPASRRAAAGSVDDLLKNTRPHRDPCSAVHHSMPCKARFGTLSSSVPVHLHHLHRQRSKGSTRDASVGSTDSLYIVEPYSRSQSTMALVEQPLTEVTQTEGISTDSLNASTRSMPGLHVGVGTDVGTREMGCETDWVFGEGRVKKRTKTDTGMNTRPIRARTSDTIKEAKKKSRIAPSNRRPIKEENANSRLNAGKAKVEGSISKSRLPELENKRHTKHEENGGFVDNRKGGGRDKIDGRGKVSEGVGNIGGNNKMKVRKDKTYGERHEVDEGHREADRNRSDIDEVFYLDETGGGTIKEDHKSGERDGKRRDVTDHEHKNDDDPERSKPIISLNENLAAVNNDEKRRFYISPDLDQGISETMSKSYPEFRRTSQFGEISTIFESDREADEGSSRRPDLRPVPKKTSEEQQREAALTGPEQDKSGDQDEETIAESHVSSSEARSSILDSDLDVMPREMPTDPADLRHVEKRRSSLLKVATDDTEQDSNSEYYLFPGEQSTASGVTNTPVGIMNERVSTWFHKNIFYQSFPIDGGAEVLMPGDDKGSGIRVASVQIAITRVVHNPNVHVEPPDLPTIVSTLTYPIRQLYPLPMSNHLHPVVTSESGRHGVESCPSRVIYEVDKQGANHPLKMKWTVLDAHQTSSRDVEQKTPQGQQHTQKPAAVHASGIPKKTSRPTVGEVNTSRLPNQSNLEQLTSGNRDKVMETTKDKKRTIEAKAVPATSGTDRTDTPPDLIPRPTSPVPPKHPQTRSPRPQFENPIDKPSSEPTKKTKSSRPDSLNLVPNYEAVYLKSNRQSALDFWRQREATSRTMATSKTMAKRNALNTSVGSSYQQRRHF